MPGGNYHRSTSQHAGQRPRYSYDHLSALRDNNPNSRRGSSGQPAKPMAPANIPGRSTPPVQQPKTYVTPPNQQQFKLESSSAELNGLPHADPVNGQQGPNGTVWYNGQWVSGNGTFGGGSGSSGGRSDISNIPTAAPPPNTPPPYQIAPPQPQQPTGQSPFQLAGGGYDQPVGQPAPQPNPAAQAFLPQPGVPYMYHDSSAFNEFVPGGTLGVKPGGGSTPLQYPAGDYNALADYISGLGNGWQNSVMRLPLLQAQLGFQQQDLGLQDRANAFNLMNAQFGNGALQDSLLGAVTGQLGQGTATAPAMDADSRAALLSSLHGTLNDPGMISNEAYGMMQQQERENSDIAKQNAISDMQRDLASRGIEGGLSTELLGRTAQQADAQKQSNLRDLAIQKATGDRQGLDAAQQSLQGYLMGDYDQRLAGADLGSLIGNRNAGTGLDLMGQLYGQDYQSRQSLANILLGTNRTPVDLSNLTSMYAALKAPPVDVDEGSGFGNVIGQIAGSLGGSLFQGIGSGLGALFTGGF